MRKKPLKSRFKIKQQEPIILPENLTDESLLTREEAATYLRFSVRTLIRRIKEGKIREVKHGNVSRIKKAELDRLLNGNGKSTVPPRSQSKYTDAEIDTIRKASAEREAACKANEAAWTEEWKESVRKLYPGISESAMKMGW